MYNYAVFDPSRTLSLANETHVNLTFSSIIVVIFSPRFDKIRTRPVVDKIKM